jgi:hypothetical protein
MFGANEGKDILIFLKFPVIGNSNMADVHISGVIVTIATLDTKSCNTVSLW